VRNQEFLALTVGSQLKVSLSFLFILSCPAFSCHAFSDKMIGEVADDPGRSCHFRELLYSHLNVLFMQYSDILTTCSGSVRQSYW